MTLRHFARIGVAGALTVGSLGPAATPALAAEVDLGIEAVDVIIAADAGEKGVKHSITNDGTTRPEDVTVVYDVTGLDAKKVKPEGDGQGCTGTDGPVATCVLPRGAVPAPGGTADMLVPLTVAPGATGAAGSMTITVKVAGDTNRANDTRTVRVVIGDNGADLVVVAADVTEYGGDDAGPTGRPVPPGRTGALLAFVENHGDMTAAGVTVEVKLPEQTTFEYWEEDCLRSADKRSLTCTVKGATLLPIGKGIDPDRPRDFVLPMIFVVRVSAAAEGPVSLKGGVVTVAAIEQKPFAARRSRAAAPLPAWATSPRAAAVIAQLDVDTADNTDGFVVQVADRTAGDGGAGDGGAGDGGAGDGGTGDGGDDGGAGDGGGDEGGDAGDGAGTGGVGGGDDDGDLPLTGPAGLAVGGTGLAVLVAGLVMFGAARRRRVVLVTPADEK